MKTKEELKSILEIEMDTYSIMKGNWSEHQKAEKDMYDMYGGKHWRSIRIRDSKEEVRAALEVQHNLIKEIEEELIKITDITN
jgi:hypothetical protein